MRAIPTVPLPFGITLGFLPHLPVVVPQPIERLHWRLFVFEVPLDVTLIAHQIQQLANNFDIIFIEGSSLEHSHNAKEWSMFARKILPVFENGKALSDDDKHAIDYLKEINGKMTGWVYNKTLSTREKKSFLKKLLNG